MIIAYNTKMVTLEEAPKRWTDLLKPKWKGKVVMGDPRSSGVAIQTVGSIVEQYGWVFYDSLRANDAKVVKTNSGAAKKVTSGEFPLCITIDYTVREIQQDGSPIGIIFPEDGAVAIPSPIGIFRDAPNPKEAKLLLDFILSKEGQEILVKKGSFVSVRGDVPPPKGSPTRDEIIANAIPRSWVMQKIDTKTLQQEFEKRMIY